MSNRYKIYPELNLGVAKLDVGVKSFEELYKLAKDFREEIHFSEVYYQLTDLRGCSFDFDRSKLSSMAALIEEHQMNDNQKIGVYLIDEPVATAYAHLFFSSIKYKREFCSTVEKAYRLLSIKIPFSQFKKLINI